MGDGVTIQVDLGLDKTLPYLVDSVLGFFGKDAASQDWKAKLKRLLTLSAQQASMVQCVGMPDPIPITRIYQRTAVCLPAQGKTVLLQSIISAEQDAVIFAGPGWGKTTLLHWTYIEFSKEKGYVPLLFTLRWPDAVKDLGALVQQFESGSGGTRKDQRILLLVDGYDEIGEEQQRAVSEILMRFSSLSVGNFYLTCRTHYFIYDLKCRHLELGPFSSLDACRFIEAYSEAYGSAVDGSTLLQELEAHHLGEFWRHPLMLTLVCILKSGPSKQIPRRAIGLLRRAVDTLAFRWDEAKGVHRHSAIPLDGEERIRCLMRIAFDMDSPQAPWEAVVKSAGSHLVLLQVKGVDIRQLLEEMARFYGILVPAGEGYWQFAHRTVHDYLSARHWVESGGFNPYHVANWDIHAAYAASLTTDATDAMLQMLQKEKDLLAFTECLYNMAPFRAELVARGVIRRAAGVVDNRPGLTVGKRIKVLRQNGVLAAVSVDEDVYGVCSDEFLRVLLREAAAVAAVAAVASDSRSDAQELDTQEKEAAAAVAICAAAELLQRNARIRKRHTVLLKYAVQGAVETCQCTVGGRGIHFSLDEFVRKADGQGAVGDSEADVEQ